MKIFLKCINAFVLAVAVLLVVILVRPHSTRAATIGVPTDFLSISKGLVGWWTFDGGDMIPNVRDRSGNNSNGNLNGATTTVIGKAGQALSFNGVNNRVNLGNPTALQIVSAGTISIWIKSTTPCGYPILAANFDWDVDTNGYGFAVFNDCVDNVALMIANGSAYNSTAAGAGTFDGKWHLITGTWDGSSLYMYRDGVNISGTAQTITPVTNVNNFVIGGNEAGNYPLQASLDDFRIYNRALSATEVRQLYNISVPKHSVTPADPLKNGLIGQWTFDGKDTNWNTNKTNDVSGNANNASLSNTSTTTSPVQGKLGQALKFDGVDDFATVGDISLLNIGTSDWTSSAWIKTTAINGVIVGKMGYIGSGPDAWGMSLSPTGRPSGVLYQLSGDVLISADDGAILTDGKWHNVAMTWNRSGNLTRYVDGVATGTPLNISSLVGQNLTSTKAVEIGARDQSGDELFFNGSIDDARIYNRALSSAEVRQLYNVGLSNISVTPTDSLKNGLVGWWTMDGKDVNWATGLVNDLSGNGNTANMTGLATATAPVSGKIGQAFKFNRTNYFKAPDSASTRVNGDLSVSSWVKINSYNTNGSTADPIVYAGTTGGCFHSWTLNVGMDSKFWMTIEPGNCDYTQGTVKDTGVFTLNRWYNVASTYNVTSGNLILYVNGVQVDQRTVVGRFNSDAGISVGADPAFQSWNEGVDGIIDDVRVYNRVLTASEMRQIYNSGR